MSDLQCPATGLLLTPEAAAHSGGPELRLAYAFGVLLFVERVAARAT